MEFPYAQQVIHFFEKNAVSCMPSEQVNAVYLRGVLRHRATVGVMAENAPCIFGISTFHVGQMVPSSLQGRDFEDALFRLTEQHLSKRP